MSYLFDTNAVSEVFRKRPNLDYVVWLRQLGRDEQFTSAVVVGELYAGAFESKIPEKWVERIEGRVLPAMSVLPFDTECARVFGKLRAILRSAGKPIDDVDGMIAATAMRHGMTLVTANVKHFGRVRGLKLHAFVPGQLQ